MSGKTEPDPDVPVLKDTPGGWMARALDIPRIAVMGESPEAALEQFHTSRDSWRELIALAATGREEGGQQ